MIGFKSKSVLFVVNISIKCFANYICQSEPLDNEKNIILEVTYSYNSLMLKQRITIFARMSISTNLCTYFAKYVYV